MILKCKISVFSYQGGIFCLLLALCAFSHLHAKEQLSPINLQEKYAAVAERAMPAVVTVYSNIYRGAFLQKHGVGSGFLISEDGYIVTNHHVIKHADVLIVKLFDGVNVQAKLVGVSPRTDLAVIKIKTRKKLPFLKFADTNKVKIGHYAIAIGSPFSLSQTMTTGIVSYKGRELGLHYREDYIQTDAAINPGNSGGPLLNIDGEVIGVNDCIIGPQAASNARGNVGLGFAIDGNLARIIVLCILKQNLTEKPFVGITMAEYNKKSPPIVTKVLPNSPAAEAGITVGDHILKIGSRKVNTIWDVQTTVLALYNPGEEAIFTFLRNKKIMNTKVKVGSSK